jgi:hypothetical protein
MFDDVGVHVQEVSLVFSMGIRARLAPLSLATWRGSTRERTRFDVAHGRSCPLRINVAGCRGAFADGGEYGDKETHTPNSPCDLVVQQV